MARILIAGCGDLGSALAQKLLSSGHEVVGLRRHWSKAAVAGIEPFRADLTRPATLESLSADFDLLVVIVTPDERTTTGYENTYVRGVGHLLQHFDARGSRPRVVYVSSTRVYGQQHGEWVDEESPTEPVDDCGRMLLAAEQQVMGHRDDNLVVRFSGIYGRGSNYLLRQLKSGRPVQQWPPLYTNRIHREDCIGALGFLVGRCLAGQPLAPVYLVSDAAPAPKWEVLCWLASQLKLAQPEPLTHSAGAAQGKRCDSRRIQAAGYQLRYPSYREGYADIALQD